MLNWGAGLGIFLKDDEMFRNAKTDRFTHVGFPWFPSVIGSPSIWRQDAPYDYLSILRIAMSATFRLWFLLHN